MTLDVIGLEEFRPSDIPAVKKFCDRAIGTDYYSEAELKDMQERSTKNSVMCSFVLWERPSKTVVGIRISFPPGQWHKGKGQGLRSDLWKFPLEQVGYFQSLFLDDRLQGKGWGAKVSQASIEALKRAGARGIATHAWKESPHDSSRKYLRKLGFEFVAEHPLYWNKVDYVCTRCGKPCVCTAEEMIKYL